MGVTARCHGWASTPRVDVTVRSAAAPQWSTSLPLCPAADPQTTLSPDPVWWGRAVAKHRSLLPSPIHRPTQCPTRSEASATQPRAARRATSSPMSTTTPRPATPCSPRLFQSALRRQSRLCRQWLLPSALQLWQQCLHFNKQQSWTFSTSMLNRCLSHPTKPHLTSPNSTHPTKPLQTPSASSFLCSGLLSSNLMSVFEHLSGVWPIER